MFRFSVNLYYNESFSMQDFLYINRSNLLAEGNGLSLMKSFFYIFRNNIGDFLQARSRTKRITTQLNKLKKSYKWLHPNFEFIFLKKMQVTQKW